MPVLVQTYKPVLISQSFRFAERYSPKRELHRILIVPEFVDFPPVNRNAIDGHARNHHRGRSCTDTHIRLVIEVQALLINEPNKSSRDNSQPGRGYVERPIPVCVRTKRGSIDALHTG